MAFSLSALLYEFLSFLSPPFFLLPHQVCAEPDHGTIALTKRFVILQIEHNLSLPAVKIRPQTEKGVSCTTDRRLGSMDDLGKCESVSQVMFPAFDSQNGCLVV